MQFNKAVFGNVLDLNFRPSSVIRKIVESRVWAIYWNSTPFMDQVF